MPRHSPRLLALERANTLIKPRRFLPRRSQRVRDQKKQVLTTYVKQRPTVLDNLPLDIISKCIFPFLDYETRNNLNQCLPPWDRVVRKMAKNSLMKHHVNVCCSKASSILTSLEEEKYKLFRNGLYNGNARILRTIEILSLFLNDDYFTLYSSSLAFRMTFSEKIAEFASTAPFPGGLRASSQIYIDELVSVCDRLRNKIEIYEGELTDNLLFTIPSLKFT